MADLGIFYYIQNALSEGKSKGEITETLRKNGHTDAEIAESFLAVEHHQAPGLPQVPGLTKTPMDLPKPPKQIGGGTVLFVLLCLMGGGYFFFKPEVDKILGPYVAYLSGGSQSTNLPSSPHSITEVGDGWWRYTNNVYNFSLNFPGALTATLTIQGALPQINRLTTSKLPPYLHVFIFDKTDTTYPQHDPAAKLKPPAKVLEHVTAGGVDFVISYNETNQELVAQPTSDLGSLTDPYVVSMALDPIDKADLPTYQEMLRQMLISLVVS